MQILTDEMNWADIIATPANELVLGTTKTLTLKNGETYLLQVVDRTNGLVLGFKDLYGTNAGGGRAINKNGNYNRDYKDSDLRAWLNGAFYDLLPGDFKAALAPADRVSGGEILKDKVFIPSETELRGKLVYGECEEGTQFELYKDWHNRIAGYPDGDYGRWYWNRTKASASNFCACNNDGIAFYNRATIANGVRPHFLII